ncbi:unnamed protein product [Rhizophagus irregularis]|nr:unnamed protein product [Rhizophagus irregularis]
MLWIIPVGINFKGLREMMIFSYNLKIFFFQYFIHIIKNGFYIIFYCSLGLILNRRNNVDLEISVYLS